MGGGSSQKGFFGWLHLLSGIAVNFAIIAGLYFTYVQYEQHKQAQAQAERTEKIKVAMEVIRETKTREFLDAFVRVKSVYHSVTGARDSDMDQLLAGIYGRGSRHQNYDAYLLEINFILGVYDHAVCLYQNGHLDRETLDRHLPDQLQKFMKYFRALREGAYGKGFPRSKSVDEYLKRHRQ